MPRHLQQWVLIGVTVVMIGIIALTGSPSRPDATDPTASPVPVVNPNQQRIEEYQRRIQEQAQRLAAEQAQLELAKEALAATAPGTTAPGTAGNASLAPERRPSAAGPPPEPSTPDRSTRDEQARFADNVAYSRPNVVPGSAVFAPVPAIVDPSAPPTPAPAPEVDSAPAVDSALAVDPTRTLPPPTGGERRYRLYEGTVIETVLTNRLDGTFSGPVNCLVSVPVYAANQQHLVIPAGARVLGEARAVNAFGQSRLAVAFHRLLLPDGTSINLNGFHGLNQVGDLGLQDQVDRHYGQIFGTSLAIGALAGLAQVHTSVGFDATGADVLRQNTGANISQSSIRILDRFLNLLPTVTIREGHRIKVYLSNDLDLPAYRQAHRPTGGRP